MAADQFFARWSKPKPAPVDVALPVDPAGQPMEPLVATEPPIARLAPTMDDVAQLTRDSDYAPFMARGVDQLVQRGAMKKLFSDPHFNLMDGLDIYIGDYNTPDPIPVAMLALLEHAKGVLDPLSMFEKPVMQLISTPKPEAKVALEPEPQPESNFQPDSEAPLAPAPDAPAEQVLPDSPLDSPPPESLPLEHAFAAAPETAVDSGFDTALDAASLTILPDTNEHTIQGL